MKDEFNLTSTLPNGEHGTSPATGHEPTSAGLSIASSIAATIVQTSPPAASTAPQITSESAAASSSSGSSSSASVPATILARPSSASSSAYKMNGDSKPMLATSTPVMAVTNNNANAFGGGVTGASGTSSPSIAPQSGRWGGAPLNVSNGHSHSSSLNTTTTTASQFQYGNNSLPSMASLASLPIQFDYSQHLNSQQQQSQQQRPWVQMTATGSLHSSHANQQGNGRAGGGGGGGVNGGAGHVLPAFVTASDYYTPRGIDPNSGMLGGGALGGPSGPPGAGQAVAGATPSSLLHPMPQNAYHPGAIQIDQADPFVYPPLTAHGHTPPLGPGRLKKGKSPKKADGKQPTFLTKLYDILDRAEYQHIIRWDEAGEMIIIERPDELADKILPLVYRQSRFASFSRQLNIYGWMRKVSLRHVESGIHDPDASTWSHATLRRNSSKEDILKFKRRVPPRPSQAQKKLQQELNSSDSDSLPPSAFFGENAYSALLGGLDETAQTSQFVQPPDNPNLPRYLPTRAPYPTVTRTNFGPEPTPPTRPPHLTLDLQQQQQQLPFTLDRKDGSGSRRLSMPAFAGERDSRYILKDAAMTNSFAPSSAPATAGNFSMLNLQQYAAPRRAGSDGSVASSFSPHAGFAKLELNGAEEGSAIADDDFARGTAEQPQFRTDDPASWARRGYTSLEHGIRPSPAMGIYGCVDPKITNASSFHLHGLQNVPIPNVNMGMQAGFMNPMSAAGMMPAAAPMPMSGVMGPRSEASQPATPPSTVSPGVYQKGFGQAQGWASPSGAGKSSPALSSKKERRQSLTSPYSTSTSPKGHAGVVRGVGGNSKRDSLTNVNLNIALSAQVHPPYKGGEPTGESGTSSPSDDEGLPSASLDRPALFSGQLEMDAGANGGKENAAAE